MLATAPNVDMLIVGAGLSGIGMAAHLEMECPDRNYTILEMRDNLGGTWDLFKYPGIRSDSDMHTLGFIFEPWKHEKTIADAPAIMEYLNTIVDQRNIRGKIQFQRKVIAADWHSDTARWHVTVELPDGSQTIITASFLYLASGYYDYDEPYDAGLDTKAFKGQVIHPQFFPEDLDYTDKKVVVIGSGATAVTITPSMADKAAHVTMLQRTPTWMFARPAKDAIANFLRTILPEKLAYKITRWKNIRFQDYAFKQARKNPEKVKALIKRQIAKTLGTEHYDEATFTAPYDPWDQRLCLVPDADLFKAMKAGKASIVTARISRFTETGIELDNGEHLDADIIITATGLKLAIAGKMTVRQDGEIVDFAERFYYKGCMFSNLPNLAVVFGYLNASWTLRADINSAYICRLLNKMKASGTDIALPVLPDDHKLEEDDVFDFSSGYIQRGKHIMPRNAVNYPWRLNQEYLVDRKIMAESPIDDGVLALRKVGSNAIYPHEQLETEE